MANHNHQPESGQKIDEELSDFLMAVLLLYLRCTSLKSKSILLFLITMSMNIVTQNKICKFVLLLTDIVVLL